MRRFLICLFFVTIVFLSQTTQARKLALLVGVDDYDNVPSLKCCVNDMKALKNALMKIGFKESDIILLTTGSSSVRNLPTKEKIEQKVTDILAAAQEDDIVFFAFSGHGAREGQTDYFCPPYAKPDNLEGTCVSITKVMDDLSKCKAKFKWMVVDACRNDPNNSRNVKAFQVIPAPPQGIALFQSCDKGEMSYEEKRVGGNGYFTKNLVAALSGDADSNHDGKLTLLEVCTWTTSQTQEDVAKAENKTQRPYLNLSAADFTLSEDMNVPKARKLVEEARKAMDAEDYDLAIKKYDEAIALCPRFESLKRYRNYAQKMKEMKEKLSSVQERPAPSTPAPSSTPVQTPSTPPRFNTAQSNTHESYNTPDDNSGDMEDEDYFSSRSYGKARAAAMGGATTESERAVALGLQWIANHQLPNGAWSFNHQLSPSCQGACKNPGKFDKVYNAATGLALLPFLGAGVTHQEGKYKLNVYNGINYLCKNGKQTPVGCVSFMESDGTIYSHGIAALCLVEAYGMTKDKRILPAAQGSLNYICFHQDSKGGGWRYEPHQAGDSSATSWQVSALKTASMSGLRVPDWVISKSSLFLDSVQTDFGAKYGYTAPGAGPSTTSMALLCRMYTGWNHDNPNLQRGVEWLSQIGPSKSDSYYNYYATQLMYQYNGPLWKKWNAVMRDQLVNSQVQQGHEKGSWYHAGSWSERGGRLYDTAMSTMILEVYYRHPQIYKTNKGQE